MVASEGTHARRMSPMAILILRSSIRCLAAVDFSDFRVACLLVPELSPADESDRWL